MRIERAAAVLAIAATGAAARAQPATGRIEGSVYDEVPREALAAVMVVASSAALGTAAPSAITDDHGHFVLDGLPPGTYVLTFYYDGLTSQRSEVVVSAGATVTLLETLEETAPPPETPVVVLAGGAWQGDRASSSLGGGVDAVWLGYERERVVDGMEEARSPWLAEAGGLAVVGRGGAGRRDVIDVHARLGAAWLARPWLQPYLAGGADLLQITSHDGARTARGTTLGLSVAAGVLGRLSEHLEYSVTAGWTDAVVPGTGDALDALVVQIGLGGRFHVKGSYP